MLPFPHSKAHAPGKATDPGPVCDDDNPRIAEARCRGAPSQMHRWRLRCDILSCLANSTLDKPSCLRLSRYYERVPLSKRVTCETVIRTGLWNSVVCFGRPVLVRTKIGTTGGRMPFCWYPVRASARQFQPDTALQVIEQVKYQSHGGRPLSSKALQCPQRGPSAIIGLRICGDQWNPLNYSLRIQLGSGQN